MNLMDRYLEQTTYASYEDFAQNLRILVPDNFNFAFDIIDEYARLEPDRFRIGKNRCRIYPLHKPVDRKGS